MRIERGDGGRSGVGGGVEDVPRAEGRFNYRNIVGRGLRSGRGDKVILACSRRL